MNSLSLALVLVLGSWAWGQNMNGGHGRAEDRLSTVDGHPWGVVTPCAANEELKCEDSPVFHSYACGCERKSMPPKKKPQLRKVAKPKPCTMNGTTSITGPALHIESTETPDLRSDAVDRQNSGKEPTNVIEGGPEGIIFAQPEKMGKWNSRCDLMVIDVCFDHTDGNRHIVPMSDENKKTVSKMVQDTFDFLRQTVDVPAIQETRQSDSPCNLSSSGSTVCMTGPYKAWTCSDKSRILLTAEDGKRHCIKFPEAK